MYYKELLVFGNYIMTIVFDVAVLVQPRGGKTRKKHFKKKKTYKKKKFYKKKKTYKKKKFYKKKKTYKKIHGGMFRIAKGLALETIPAGIERSKLYEETQKKLEKTVNDGYNYLQHSLTNDENRNINLENFSPEKSFNPLKLPKVVSKAKNAPYKKLFETTTEGDFPM
jgi:hypothetical protein